MTQRALAYTTYSEAGGVGKTTLTANLGAAHARAGDDVLLVDLDPQEGCLSYLLDVVDGRADQRADSLARHLVRRPRGPFEDLVHPTAEPGLDVVPSHQEIELLTEWLVKAQEREGWSTVDRYRQLRRVLRDADVGASYDVVIVDPPATTGPHLYNAIYATRAVVIPVELSGKGSQSMTGIRTIVGGLEAALDVAVDVLAVVPNGLKGTTDQLDYREAIEAMGYDVEVAIPDRTALMEGCWRQQCNAFAYVEQHRDRPRDYERETLSQIEELAASIRERAGPRW